MSRGRGSALAAVLLAAACSSSPSLDRTDVGALANEAGERVLVLGAFPTELDALLRHADIRDTTVIDGRSYFEGTLAGNEVVLALSGIGLVNAERTARTAIEAFAPDAIVFSGVSGTKFRIGDVMIPARWTEDAGATWVPVSDEMLAVAEQAAGDATLGQCTPIGDPVCIGVALPVDLSCVAFAPEVFVGGDGRSSDPFDGRALPCIPLGGDVFGCDACLAPARPAPDLAGFVEGAVPFVDPDLLADFAAWSAGATSGFDVDDMETAAVARVAHDAGIPFLGIRSASDGAGDPLGLPGFPVQFFAYRVLAAENAGAVTRAFLERWAARP